MVFQTRSWPRVFGASWKSLAANLMPSVDLNLECLIVTRPSPCNVSSHSISLFVAARPMHRSWGVCSAVVATALSRPASSTGYIPGDEWYYVCRETRLHHVVRRGAQEPQADLARGYICRRGFLQPGGSASSSGGFGGSDPCLSTKVLWSPCVGCDVCEEVFREHPQCQSCRLGPNLF